ncbi:AAA family ATPase [Leptolyngbya sp. NIES-2104]|uniref:AAA family ATPase n=1 Tax=Leptolyngbya sp. NIES-2104 TaxID=1552121 RepID=UPI0006EC94EA|nr:AAA family ATPase [Leptolyngbya sp. NIES-2104]GAP99140.1 DNA repair protein RadA domain protein [Leptolyngbya sp. NIES-2104]
MVASHNTPVQFDIRNFIEFDSQNRAICPACQSAKGESYTKRNLSVAPNGAYKCHRGCTSGEIRSALGAEKPRQVPTAIAKPATNITLPPHRIKEAHDRLMASDGPAKQWLHDRGITDGLIQRHQIGITRAKVNNQQHLPAITIPIPANADGTQFYQKKRVAPWIDESNQPENYKPWSQYGIPNSVYFTWLPANATQTYLCEGEWDAIRLGDLLRNADLEIACATFTSGAGNVPGQDQLDLLPGEVIIFYDRNDAPLKNGDRPGEIGARKIAKALGTRAKIASVPMLDDCSVKGWDVSNAIEAGYSLDDFKQAAAESLALQPDEPKKRENPLRARMIKNIDLIARAADYIDWLVPDLLTPNELFILGTPPRTGKSLFCLTLAKAIATGGTFLDRPVTQGSVIYVNCEDGETKVKYRQTAQGWEQWGYDLPVYWFNEFKLSELSDLRELIEEIGDVRLLVLDTLSRVRNDNAKESSSEMGRILEPLQQLARDTGTCVLLTHHLSEATLEKDDDPFKLLRGNSSIRSTCRGAMVMLPGENCYRLISENGWCDLMDLNVRIQPDTLEWKLLGNWNPRVDGDMKQQILDHLNLVGIATIQEIATELNFNAGSVCTILHRLQREDMVEKIGGKGRQLAHYQRSATLSQQLNMLLGHQNPDDTSDTACPNKKILENDLPLKVINSPKSDQSETQENFPHERKVITFSQNDHFFSNTPPLLGQSCKPDPVSDVCPNSPDRLLGQGDQLSHRLDPVLTPLKVGDRAVYIGPDKPMSMLCGNRHLEILEMQNDRAIVKNKKWVVSQTVPLADLRRV